MPLQNWTVYAFETVTGRIAAEIPFINVCQYEYGLNNVGTGTVTVPLGGNGISAADINELTQPWRWSWAICYKQYICQAGPVISEQMTDTQPYTQVTFGGIWKLFSKRILFPSTFTSGTNPAVSAADTQYTGLTYLQMASNIVGTSMARGAVPIVLPPTDPPGSYTIQYYGYDMNLVADMLTNLTGLVNGPEIEFRPQFNPAQPNYIQWLMRVGSPRLGQLGSSWAFDYGPRGSIQQMDFGRDGSQMTFSDYTRGSGSQYSLLVGNGQDLGLVNSGYPLLEDVNGDHTTVVDQGTANSYAQQWCDTYQYPVNSPGALVRVDALDLSGSLTGSPTLDQIAVGDTASFTTQSHRRIPDGTYTYRIVQIDNGTSYDNAKLTLQPVTGVS